MRLDSTAARLLGTTARLESRGAAGVSHGTGFVYEVRVRGGGTRLFRVSSRHQFEMAGADLSIELLVRGDDGLPSWGQTSRMSLTHPAPRWFGHPTLDVAVLPLHSIIDPSRPVFAVSADVSMTRADEEDCDALEAVLTIGYPNGLRDSVNRTPICRQGITATPIGLDYEGDPAFCIDAATFQGSSGSPVFCLMPAAEEARSRFEVLGQRAVFAGVVSALHERRAVGDIKRVDAATALELTINNPMHLGIVVKARSVDECVDLALSSVAISRATPAPRVVPLRRPA